MNKKLLSFLIGGALTIAALSGVASLQLGTSATTIPTTSPSGTIDARTTWVEVRAGANLYSTPGGRVTGGVAQNTRALAGGTIDGYTWVTIQGKGFYVDPDDIIWL